MMSPRRPIFSTSCLRITCIKVPPLASDYVWQKSHLAGALYRYRRFALVLRAKACHPAGTDLAAIRDELAQHVVVLVVYVRYVLLVEYARLALYRPLAARRRATPS